MTQPIETLEGTNALAFKAAIKPFLLAILNDENFKSANYIDEQLAAAEVVLSGFVEAAAGSAASVAGVADKIDPLGNGNVTLTRLPPESGWMEAWRDPVTKRGILGVARDGRFFPFDLRTPANEQVWDILPRMLPAESGVLYGVSGPNGRAVFAARSFGTEPDGTGRFVADIAIKPYHISRELDLDLYRNRRQARQVWPDGIRSIDAPITAYTSRSGFGWASLARALTPLLEGAHSTALQFRRSTGLNIIGTRYIGTWNPSAAGVNSIRKIGTVSNTGSFQPGGGWTPAPSPTVGDYYDVFLIGGGSINLVGTWMMYPGDMLVWSGSAWVVQSAPHATALRYDGDWWEVTNAATYDGVALAVGDKVAAFGGPYYTRYIRIPTGRYALRGEWSAATAFPTGPINNDLWQVTVAGTQGGITFAVDDYLVRKSGAWAKVPTTPISAFAANEYAFLPVHRASDEWEVRRTDKSVSIFAIQMTGQVQQSVQVATSNTIHLYSDSMGRFLLPALQTAFAAEGLSVRVPGYNSSGASEVAAMLEADILQGVFDPAGQIVLGWFGQNNEASIPEVIAAHLRIKQLLGDHGGYYLPISALGRATMSWNGTRFVGLWHEPQKNNEAANGMVRIKADVQAHFPGQMLDSWGTIVSGVTSTLPHLQYPGMTEAQASAVYGANPLSYYFDWAAIGVNPALATYKGTRSTTGLPTGGVAHDYFLRTVAGGSTEEVGNILYNVAGTWTEIRAGSPNSAVHMLQTCQGNSDLSNGAVANLKTKKWIKP